MADAAKDWQRYLSVAHELEALEEMLAKESYLDPEDNPLKLLRRLRALSEKLPAQQKEYTDLLHQEQEIAERIRDVTLRNAGMLEALEQRTETEPEDVIESSRFEDAYRQWEAEHIKETEQLHDRPEGVEVYQRSAASKAALAELKEKENKLRMRPVKTGLLPAELTGARTQL